MSGFTGRMTLLYHITHIRNLAGILAVGGLCCDRTRDEKAIATVSIAHQHIKDRRKKRPVQNLSGESVAAGGTLWDYVPFYFAPRSPMLYTINQGHVEGYRDGQRPIVHLVTSAERLSKEGSVAFTNGHAEMIITEFETDLSRIPDLVDRKIMESRYWNDTIDIPTGKDEGRPNF